MSEWTLADVLIPLIGTLIAVTLVTWMLYRKREKTVPHKEEKSYRGKYDVDDGVTLFDNEHSENCRRVRIALLEKNISFRKINIDIAVGEQHTSEFILISPNAEVPALRIKNVKDVPDCTLNESNVIIEFLDAVFPGPRLYTDEPWERTRIRMWQDWEQEMLRTCLILGILSIVDTPGDGKWMISLFAHLYFKDYQAVFYQNLHGFLTRLVFGSVNALEATFLDTITRETKMVYLRSCAGGHTTRAELEYHAFALYKALFGLEMDLDGKDFLVGGSLTAADLAVFPRLSMFPVIGLPVLPEIFPHITRYMDGLSARDSVVLSEDSDTRRLKHMIKKYERIFVWISNIRSGSRHARFNGSTALSRACALYKDMTDTEPAPSNVGNSRTLTELSISAESWQSTLLLMEKEMSFRMNAGDVLDVLGRSLGCRRLQCLSDGVSMVTGQQATLEYIDRTGSGKSYLPVEPLLKARVQCWQAWERALYVRDIAPLIETEVLAHVLVTRYKHNVDSLMLLEYDPHHADRFAEIVRCFLLGMKKRGDHVTEMLTKYTLTNIPSFAEQQEEFGVRLTAIQERLDYLESVIKTRVYLVGDEVTLADMCVFCRLQQLTLLDIDISVERHPCILKWMSKLTERPGFFAIAASVKLPHQLV